jgi:hypothetical protein
MSFFVGLRHHGMRRVRRVRALGRGVPEQHRRFRAIHARPGFEDQHRHTASRKRVRGDRAGDARPDDDDVRGQRHYLDSDGAVAQ